MRLPKSWSIEPLESRDLLSGAAGLELPAPHAVGTDAGVTGTAILYNRDGTIVFQVIPYGPDFTGGVRVALGDVNADGTADLITAPGPGTAPHVKVFSGVDGSLLGSFFAFEPSFTGGTNVTAGDFDQDGAAEIVVSAEVGGGPRVRILAGADGSRSIVDFFAIEDENFRGGARTAVGDVSGDGVPELIVGAGVGGGSRVSVYEGSKLLQNPSSPTRLLNDFFAFDNEHRDGVQVATGDLNGDGYADLVFGGGPETGPRIRAWDGREFMKSGGDRRVPLLDTYAFDPAAGGGVRMSVGDVNNDGLADIVVGQGPGESAEVRAFLGGGLGKSLDLGDSSLDGSTSTFVALDSPKTSRNPRGANTAPQITDIADQSVLSGSSATVAFEINDQESPKRRLQVSAISSNPSLIPAAGIALGGTNADRTLTITPAAGQSGTAVVTVTVTDPDGLSASDSLTVTVPGSPVSPPPVSTPPVGSSPPPVSVPVPAADGNNAPQLSNVPNQAVPISGATGPLAFTVSDVETPASDLIVTATSSNPAFVPASAIVLGGSGSNRSVSVTPIPGQSGTTTVSLTVTDGSGATSTKTFVVYASDPIQGINSPTGRNPKLLWTPQQQAIWERMRSENHEWWQAIKNSADATGTPNERYNDFGQWATLAYQITGDPAYAAKAYDKLASSFLGRLPGSRNETREYFAELVMLYDWLSPALNSGQRENFINTLNMWGDAVLDAATWGTSPGDSDEAIGHYFGLALLDIATAPDNPRAGTFLNRTWNAGGLGVMKPVGGLDATGANDATLRNAISRFVQSAAGGQWIESSEYNIGTLKLLIIGTQGIKTATGVDHFPEVTAYLKQAALSLINELTPDLEGAYQWGDNQGPRELYLLPRVTLLGMLAGLTQDDPQVGPYVNEAIYELLDKHQLSGGPWWRFFYLNNPYAPRADWRGALPQTSYSPGVGVLFHHTGWSDNDSLFGAQMTNRVRVDHEVHFFGDFQLYRDGEWAVTHSLGYGGPAVEGVTANSMMIGGLSSMINRGPVAQATAADGSWTYFAGTTNGVYYDSWHSFPPAEFLHEWTRSLFYLPSSDKTSDTIIVFDRVNAEDPHDVPGFEGYLPADRDAINSAPALKQWIIHAPVVPTVSSNAISWTTAGGQQVQVTTLGNGSFDRTVYDEDQLWPSPAYYNYYASEKNYQVRITPKTEQQWDTFLNVVQASNPGTALTNVGVQSTGGEASGALIQRAGQADTLVMFGAQEASRVLTSGYTTNWTAGAASTNLFLMDLDPTKSWKVSVNGGAPTPLAVSAQGIGQMTVAGSGAMSLQLSN